MPDLTGFTLEHDHDRAIVRLRVRPRAAQDIAARLDLPQQALRWLDGDPVSHWLGPDQWLMTSRCKSVEHIQAEIDRALPDRLYVATDLSAGLDCLVLSGTGCRSVLAMGCGIDLHPDVFITGHCTATHFARVPLFMVATRSMAFELYVDNSYSDYLKQWLAAASEDPLTQQQ